MWFASLTGRAYFPALTCHRTAMLALATASPCSTSFRPFGCLPLRVAVRWRYRDGEHQGPPAAGFDLACGPHRTGNRKDFFRGRSRLVCEGRRRRFPRQGWPHRGAAGFFLRGTPQTEQAPQRVSMPLQAGFQGLPLKPCPTGEVRGAECQRRRSRERSNPEPRAARRASMARIASTYPLTRRWGQRPQPIAA